MLHQGEEERTLLSAQGCICSAHQASIRVSLQGLSRIPLGKKRARRMNPMFVFIVQYNTSTSQYPPKGVFSDPLFLDFDGDFFGFLEAIFLFMAFFEIAFFTFLAISFFFLAAGFFFGLAFFATAFFAGEAFLFFAPFPPYLISRAIRRSFPAVDFPSKRGMSPYSGKPFSCPKVYFS